MKSLWNFLFQIFEIYARSYGTDDLRAKGLIKKAFPLPYFYVPSQAQRGRPADLYNAAKEPKLLRNTCGAKIVFEKFR